MPKRDKNAVVMDGITRRLDIPNDIELLVLADLHIGDPHCDLGLVKRLIESVELDPNRFCILAGDLLNNAVIGGKSDVYGEIMTPTQAMKKAVELLTPIKDKILAVVSGNHEERTSRTAGFDLTYAICVELGIPDLYQEDAGLLFIRFGRDKSCYPITYSIYINHGHGGGRRVGGKMNALQDYGSIIDADVYVVGHTHLPATFKDCSFRVLHNKGQAVLRERLFVNTASCLRYDGGYGKRQGYQPASNSYPVIRLDGHERHAYATV